MKLPAVDNEFIFIGQDPHSSSLFGNKYLPVVVVGIGEKKKNRNIARRLGMRLIATRLVCWSLSVVKWRRSSLSIRLWFERYTKKSLSFENHLFLISLKRRERLFVRTEWEERSFILDFIQDLESRLEAISSGLFYMDCFTTAVNLFSIMPSRFRW